MSCPKRPRSRCGLGAHLAFLPPVFPTPVLFSSGRNACSVWSAPCLGSVVAVTPSLSKRHARDVIFAQAISPEEALSPSRSVSPQVPDTSVSLKRVKTDGGSIKDEECNGADPDRPESEESTGQPGKVRRKRVVSVETRRKISYAMLGQRRSDQMRAKVSQKLKGRVPWNKGKKMSPETRARMSESRTGRLAWNKGKHLSGPHRDAISRSSLDVARKASPDTLRRMRMARRRPGDAVLSGRSEKRRPAVGSYPLVDGAEINDYITLRRELRVWSDSFMSRTGKRPSLADIRRVASANIMKKFEKYVQMRDRIRGLASDVYGSVDPADVPVVSIGDVSDVPRNNNAKTVIRVTKHGNRRMVDADGKIPGNGAYRVGSGYLEGSTEDMWDMYDRPTSPVEESSTAAVDNSLVGTHELNPRRRGQLNANDYRMIGKYRLMESIDINRYVKLRKELERWSADFKRQHGRIPKLSDVRSAGKSMWYDRFCEYLSMRDAMSGLVREVYRTEIDDVETFRKVNVEGKVILDSLRSRRSREIGGTLSSSKGEAA